MKLERDLYAFWSKAEVEMERRCIFTTWFDYRHIHPMLRLHVFRYEYKAASMRAYRRYFGRESPQRYSKKTNRDFFSNRNTKGVITRTIRTMHLVDQLGCPYDTFFDAAIEDFLQTRGFMEWRSQMDRPIKVEKNEYSHPGLAKVRATRTVTKGGEASPIPPLTILADGISLLNAQKTFEQDNDLRLRLPKHSHYKVKNYTGSRNQKECISWLISVANRRHERHWTLARMVYEYGVLRETDVVRHLSIDVVKKMRAIKNEL